MLLWPLRLSKWWQNPEHVLHVWCYILFFFMKRMWQDPVFILMHNGTAFGRAFNAMYIQMKKIDYWHCACMFDCEKNALNMQTEMMKRLSTRSVLLFPSLLQFSPGHCARWWRSTASSLATQSTGMWACPPPLTASFGSGPSTPTWTLYITTTATETASIITEIPSRATPPLWGG